MSSANATGKTARNVLELWMVLLSAGQLCTQMCPNVRKHWITDSEDSKHSHLTVFAWPLHKANISALSVGILRTTFSCQRIPCESDAAQTLR